MFGLLIKNMEYFFYFFIFILGTIIGSFLNVVILRHNTGRSSVKGNSMCFSCGKKLVWHELIPVLSFIFLKGRCSACRAKISWQYPLIELSTGILFVALWWKNNGIFAPFWLTILIWAIFSLLVIITVYDLRHKIIPDVFSYSLAALSIIYIVTEHFWLGVGLGESLFWRLMSGLILAAPLALLWLVSRGQWMGLGDAKLVLGLGWFLGLIYGLSALVLAFWFGAVYGLFMILLGSKLFGRHLTIKSEIPFGPFLILGWSVAYFGNVDILNLSLFLN
jgi:leader peptidase (prepilin peptidase)/N-methyltransferase